MLKINTNRQILLLLIILSHMWCLLMFTQLLKLHWLVICSDCSRMRARQMGTKRWLFWRPCLLHALGHHILLTDMYNSRCTEFLNTICFLDRKRKSIIILPTLPQWLINYSMCTCVCVYVRERERTAIFYYFKLNMCVVWRILMTIRPWSC